jgi:hypothetical protein
MVASSPSTPSEVLDPTSLGGIICPLITYLHLVLHQTGMREKGGRVFSFDGCDYWFLFCCSRTLSCGNHDSCDRDMY